jgi:hypothetical protein
MLLLPAAWAGGSSLSTSKDDATFESSAHLPKAYSPKCVEGKFSEVRMQILA